MKRHKIYSIINIFGLALGTACFLLIFTWIQDELSYDRFHENTDRIYRVVKYSDYSGNIKHAALTPGPLSNAMQQELPEVIKATSLDFAGARTEYKDKSFRYVDVIGTEPEFFEIFTYPLIKGDSQTALSHKNSIILTEKVANNIFGKEDPLGKTVTLNRQYDYLVTGIMKDIPRHSHLQFQAVIPFKKLEDFGRAIHEWRSNSYYTYIMLNKDASIKELNKKIHNFKRDHYPESRDFLYLQPLTRIHLFSNLGYDISGHGDIKYVIIFALVAGLVLLIACINFMNLTTALAGDRAKEIGLRKVVGASRRSLIIQFYAESILMSFLAVSIAVLMVVFLLPYFSNLSGKELILNIHNSIPLFGSILGIMVLTGLLSGSYPAFLLSSFKPVNVLKGTIQIGGKSIHMRKLLVIIQFTLSTFLIISTLVVSKQLHYIQSKKLGFEKKHLVYISIPYDYEGSYNTLRNELLRKNGITHVTRMRFFPTSEKVNAYSGLNWEGKNPQDQVLFCMHDVGYNFFETFGMTLLEGRSFSRALPTDTSTYIINEEAMRIMGIENPVGKLFSLNFPDGDERKGAIIGIVKNFHFKSLKNEIEPLVFRLPVHHANNIFIKVSSHDVSATLKYIEKTWKKFVPDYPCELQFLDDAYNRLYGSEIRTGAVIDVFTFLAVIITGLGLFGLASFSTEKKKKEIGIRKIAGASVFQILKLLYNEFMVLVVLANVIAWPAAYFIMKKWLQNYAYHTTISLHIYILAFAMALLIALISVSCQSIKAATANPVESLRYE